MASKAMKLAIGLMTCVSVSLPPNLAQARPRWAAWGHGHGWHGGYGHGWGYRPHHVYRVSSGYYGGYRGYSYPAYYGGYSGYGYPAYGGYYPGHYYGGPVYYRRRSNSGAALAAGLIGGIALGAILANASRPHRAYYRP